MPELFVKFGGHRAAAGVTLEGGRVVEFQERFHQWAAARLTPADLTSQIEIDAVVELREIDEHSADGVFALAPFGCGNPEPWFAALNVEVAAPPLPVKEKHLRVRLRQHGHAFNMIAWNFAARAAELAAGARLDVAFTVEPDPQSAARGYQPWQAVLREFRRAGTLQSAAAAG
jgi:single-stranded-DNA-specific exonuclease